MKNAKAIGKSFCHILDLLAKFDEKHNKYREQLKKAKNGLTKSSGSAEIEHFDVLCSDVALKMQDLAKSLKKSVDIKTE